MGWTLLGCASSIRFDKRPARLEGRIQCVGAVRAAADALALGTLVDCLALEAAKL
jgi:hypothetical protein